MGAVLLQEPDNNLLLLGIVMQKVVVCQYF